MADTPFVARKGLVSLGDITGSGHLQLNTVDGLATATEALFLDSTDTVVSRSLGTAAFSATGDFDKYVQWHLAGDADSTDVTSEKWVKFVGGASITGAGTEANPYLMDISPSSASYATFAATAATAGIATSATITTTTTNGNYDILFESSTASKIAKDTGGDFAYNPSTNTLTVGNVFAAQLTSSGLQVANINYPTSDGTNGQVISTNGSGQLSFTTIQGGTDTNIANTDLTATANRTLDMGTNNLTISASNYFIDTVSGNFEVDARNGSFKVKSDTGHYVYIEGLPNGTTTNVVGYNTTTGRLVYVAGTTLGKTYTAGTGISIDGSNEISSTITQTTVYTPDVYEISDVSVTSFPYFFEYSATKVLEGTTNTARNTAGNGITVNDAGWYEAKYSVAMQNPDSSRKNPAIRAEFSSTIIKGSRGITYLRLPGTNNAPFGSIEVSFYFQVVGGTAGDDLQLKMTLLNGTAGSVTVDGYHATSNTLSIRRIS